MLRLGRVLASGKNRRWPVVIIEAGKSKNGFIYTPHVLKEAVPLFDRAPAMAFVKLDAEGKPLALDHQRDDSKSGKEVLNQVGFYEGVRWDETKQAVVGELVLVEGIGDDYQRHLEALEKAKALDTVGLSINAVGPMPGPSGVVPGISHVTSVDIVSFPAAGGAIEAHRYAASIAPVPAPEVSPMNWFERLKKLCPRLMEGLVASDTTSAIATRIHSRLKESGEEAQNLAFLIGDVAALEKMDPKEAIARLQTCIDFVKKVHGEIKEALPTAPPAPPAPPAAVPDPAISELQKQLKESRIRESKRNLEKACADRKLPKTAVSRLLEAHKDREDIDETKADQLAKGEQDYLDQHIAGSTVGRVLVMRESVDRARDVLKHMLAPHRFEKPKDCQAFYSLHRFNEAFFGVDTRVTGVSDRQKLREAIDTTQFNQIYADVFELVLVAEYRADDLTADWRKIVRVVSHSDFRTMHIAKPGWYGFLPDVAKKAPYLPLTTPGDTEETLALAKKGGTETWSWEDQLDDRVDILQAMIRRLSRSAAETIHDHVFALIRVSTMPTLSDSKLLFDATRSDVNGGTAALSADATGKTNFINSITAMRKITGGSGQKKNIKPKYVVIPFEKQEALNFVLQAITGGNTGGDMETLLRRFGVAIPEPIIDWGTSNTTDWQLIADPMVAEVLRLAFLNGREDPEIIIADDQRFGSLFNRDAIDLKLRHVYKAGAVDYAGIYGNDAAS